MHDIFPFAKLGFITNGQKTLYGDWVKKLEWLRVSIDAGTDQKFKDLKKGDLLKSLDSIVSYLKNGCKNVGIGFVFNDENLLEIFSFTRLIYDLIIKNLGESFLENVFLEFRPTCKIESCDCPSPRYKDDRIMTSDMTPTWQATLELIRSSIFESADSSYVRFVMSRSNLDKKTLLKYQNKKLSFSECYYCLVKMVICSNGDCYPCVLKASIKEISLGNIITNTEESILYNQMMCHKGNDICNGYPSCCNVISQKNNIVEKFIDKDDIPDTSHLRWKDFI